MAHGLSLQRAEKQADYFHLSIIKVGSDQVQLLSTTSNLFWRLIHPLLRRGS